MFATLYKSFIVIKRIENLDELLKKELFFVC